MKIHIQYYKTNMMEFIIGSYDNQLCMLDFKNRKKRQSIDNRLKKTLKTDYIEQDSPVIQQTIKELDEYLNNKRESFDIPLLLIGTHFQKKVWNALIKVPYGTTTSYAQLSKNIGNEKAVRAVANANGANAIAVIIPCHRIIGKDGTLTGYAGGLDVKEKLLNLEKPT